MKSAILILLSTLLPLAAHADAGNKHVLELFTSQGCYSCPPAEALLGELIESREDIVALEFHVDYWNDLVYGSAGKWEDPFSNNEYTQRQRRYNGRGLEGNSGVYTPQAVVNGQAAVVGSNGKAIDQLLKRPAPAFAMLMLDREAGSIRVGVSGKATAPAEVWLYRFDIRNVTDVGAGENKGKTLTNHHVVREVRRLGEWTGQDQEYVVEGLNFDGGQSCAVVVQLPGQGPVLGADLCPS